MTAHRIEWRHVTFEDARYEHDLRTGAGLRVAKGWQPDALTHICGRGLRDRPAGTTGDPAGRNSATGGRPGDRSRRRRRPTVPGMGPHRPAGPGPGHHRPSLSTDAVRARDRLRPAARAGTSVDIGSVRAVVRARNRCRIAA